MLRNRILKMLSLSQFGEPRPILASERLSLNVGWWNTCRDTEREGANDVMRGELSVTTECFRLETNFFRDALLMCLTNGLELKYKLKTTCTLWVFKKKLSFKKDLYYSVNCLC